MPVAVVPGVLITLGLGLSFTPLAYAATAGVPPNEAGLASGLVNTSRQIGGAVGLAVLATVATSRTHALAGMPIRLALTDGYTLAFRIGSIVALGAGLAALLVPARRAVTAAGVAAAHGPAAEAARALPPGQVAPSTTD